MAPKLFSTLLVRCEEPHSRLHKNVYNIIIFNLDYDFKQVISKIL